MMTLEEAIQHCLEVANSKCDACGAEHRQLAAWLEELNDRRNPDSSRFACEGVGQEESERAGTETRPYGAGQAYVFTYGEFEGGFR